jgi:hypothetical protein
MLHRSNPLLQGFAMLAFLTHFAARSDVLLAGRYMAALEGTTTPTQTAVAEKAAAKPEVTEPAEHAPISLAA